MIAMLALAIATMTSLFPSRARAGEREDTATIAAVDKIVRGEIAQANFGEAKKKLRVLLDKCKKGCSPSAFAQVHIAVGLVAAQIGRADEAKAAWFDALNADANVQGTADPAHLGGYLDRAATEFRFADYAADVSATNLGERGIVVREQYRSIPN